MDFLTLDSLPPSLHEAIDIRLLVSDQILFRQGDAAFTFLW